MSTSITANQSPSEIQSDPDESRYVPPAGAYVVIQLDVETTIQRYKLDISRVAEGIKEYHPKKYLASVRTIWELSMPFKPSHKVSVEFVGTGIRAEEYEECVTPEMCTPIAPTSGHPLITREAVQPSSGFPFDDCYYYSFVTATVRVPTKPYLRRHMVTLDARDRVMLAINESDDSRKYIALKKERGITNHKLFRPSLNSESFTGFPLEPYEEDEDVSSHDEEDGMEDKQAEHRSECCTDSESMVSASSASYDDVPPLDEDDLAAIIFGGEEEFEDPDASDIPVSVNAWVDLREIEEVIDPSGFLEEVAHLRR
ncbi:uncharacterized protein C8Q71DRAFT_718519 [Rhodofomes roseus]|uniref:Uncharacterized protein n=1 Tax=Rhodofomes roseus TaxID=34475 RepID=A0ABQ8JY84_9APHY|nr:uncharacterized protein C8Q71DRAFT_718519 [Rhodofomes roseus]KAH9829224.1 hypothetical protein C8Q71DRAFT_718519 [Rhodofomes roseus]